MINIQKTVENLINKDLEGKNALARGILNLSQYARNIQADIVQAAKKEVSTQSIVVALSRLEKKVRAYNYLPDIQIKQLSIKTPIVQIVFNKSDENLASLTKSIQGSRKLDDSFFSFSSSTRDIAIIVSEGLENDVIKNFQDTPKKLKRGLSAVSILFDEQLVDEANVGLSLLHKISLRNIVLDAGITTYNEFTLVFESQYLNDAIDVLSHSTKQ